MTAARDETSGRQRDALARRVSGTVFDRPILVEAGAGTGKTSILVGRIAAWSLGPGWTRAEAAIRAATAAGDVPQAHDRIAARVLERVVAITFTEAAAAEMAMRIAAAFAAIERGTVPREIAAEALPPGGDERSRRARALLGNLDRLIVRTIHAYCRRLLSAHPLEAGIHPDFEVDADFTIRTQVIRDVVEATLQRVYGEPGDPLFLELAEAGQGPAQIQEAITRLIELGVSPETLEQDPFGPGRLESLRQDLRRSLEELLEIERGRFEGPGRTAAARETIAALRATLAGVKAAVLAEASSLLALAERIDADLPPARRNRLHKWARSDFAGAEAEALGDDAEALAAAAAELETVIDHVLRLNPILLDRARRALLPMLRQVRAQMRARGVQTFTALLRDARDLLVYRPEVAAHLKNGIDQLLVDEFQDTDRLQCDVIRTLAFTGAVESRPGLFLVGDPKQCIYGWRDADLRAYDAFVRELLSEGGEKHELTINFRSAPPILRDVTRFIAPVMRRREGIQPAFQELLPSPEREDAPGFRDPRRAPVELWLSQAWDEDGGDPARAPTRADEAAEIEARALAQDLLSLRRDHATPWREIGVLFRSTGDIDVYLGALRDAGVPYVVERDRNYFRREEVIEAAALLRCIVDPSDHLALLTLLRSGLVGVPDAALIPLWGRDFPRLLTELIGTPGPKIEALNGVIIAAAAAVPEDIPGIERIRGWEHVLRAAVMHLGALRASFATDPADVFIEKTRAFFAVEPVEAARRLGSHRLANVERFFHTVLTALEKGTDAQAVLRSLRTGVAERREEEEARPGDAAEEAVQVMTIHRAKGLDFSHVYVMQLHKKPPSQKSPPNDAADAGDTMEYKLLGAPTVGYHRVESYRSQVEAAERVRTLYVAATRAKERLVLAGLFRTGSAAPPERAQTHADLLRGCFRRDPGDVFANARGASAADDDGLRWIFPARMTAGETGALAGASSGASATAQMEENAKRLRGLRRAAASRMERPTSRAASEETHHSLRDAFATRLASTEEGAGGDRSRGESGVPDASTRGIAMAAGGAVHRALELFDLSADSDTELARQRERLSFYLEVLCPTAWRDEALARAQEILDRFRAGPLFQRFRDLEPSLVARELPILLPPRDDDTDAVGYIAGAVDLVHRDARSGELVVVDYKTDDVGSETEIEARAGTYAAQLGTYVAAVHAALRLERPPRAELWFLQAGVCVVVEREA